MASDGGVVIELDTVKPARNELSSGVTFGSQGLPVIFQARPRTALHVVSQPAEANVPRSSPTYFHPLLRQLTHI